MILTDDPVIRCNSCDAEFKIDKDMLNCDAYCMGKGGMGEQYEQDFVFKVVYEKCGQRMWLKLYAIEYPVGAQDSQFQESEGCEVIYELAIEMEYEPDIPELMLSVYEQVLYDSSLSDAAWYEAHGLYRGTLYYHIMKLR